MSNTNMTLFQSRAYTSIDTIQMKRVCYTKININQWMLLIIFVCYGMMPSRIYTRLPKMIYIQTVHVYHNTLGKYSPPGTTESDT